MAVLKNGKVVRNILLIGYLLCISQSLSWQHGGYLLLTYPGGSQCFFFHLGVSAQPLSCILGAIPVLSPRATHPQGYLLSW